MFKKFGWLTLLFAVGLSALLLSGCSGNPGPASPALISDITSVTNHSASSAPMLWGYWEVVVDTSTGEVEIQPMRGVQFTVDVVTFLQPPAGNSANLGIQVLEIDNWFSEGLITVDVRLDHPFPGLDEYTGHDVKGVFITPSNAQADSDNSITLSLGGDEPTLLNSDGYTRWQNPEEFDTDGTIFTYTPGNLGTPGTFDSTINPYKYYADDIDPDESLGDYFAEITNLEKRGQFYAGTSLHRQYELQFPMVDDAPFLIFQYAVIAHWVPAEDLNQQDLPGSFPADANAAEAIFLAATDNSSLWYLDGDSGGSLDIDCEIYNWQPYTMSGVVSDVVNSIVLDFPGGTVTPSFVELPVSGLNFSGGSTDISSVVEIELTGLALTSEDPVDVLVSVITDDGSGGTLSYDPGNTITYADSPLAGYFKTSVTVGNTATNPIVISIDPDSEYIYELVDDAIITGDNFFNVVDVRLEMDPDVLTAVEFTVDSTTQITVDFDLLNASIGFYDVVVDVGGGNLGVLEDGFEVMVQCGETAPVLDGVYTFDWQINPNWCSGILNDGPYAGMSIFPQCNDAYGGYRVFDHTTQADNTELIDWPAFAVGGNPYLIKAAPSNGLMIVMSAYQWYRWSVVDQTSGAVVQSLNHGYLNGVVGDFDADNDWWGICPERPNAGVPNVYEYNLQHYTYDDGNPTSPYSMTDEFDVTDLFRDDIGGGVLVETFNDLIMMPDGLSCFVCTGAVGDDHKIDKLDLTTDPPTVITSYSFAGKNLNPDSQYNNAHSRGVKMALDYSDDDFTTCRLVVAGCEYTVGGPVVHLYRFDSDLNLIDSSEADIEIPHNDMFYGFALDPVNEMLVHVQDFNWLGDAPVTYYGVSQFPTDW